MMSAGRNKLDKFKFQKVFLSKEKNSNYRAIDNKPRREDIRGVKSLS